MAANRWFRLIGTSFGGAAVVAIAQVGVVHGLGLIAWNPSPGDDGAWQGLLTWVVFLLATGVLAGAAAARRSIRVIHGRVLKVTARALASLCAVIGAAVAFPLLWLPSRAVPQTVAANPESAVTAAAAVGIGVGLTLAVAALISAPIGVNLAATVSWVWLFALVSTVLSYAHDGTARALRLGMIDAPQAVSRADLWFGPFLMIGIAGAFGLLVAAAGRWLFAPRLAIALSGFAGPALVAAAYLVGGPGDVADGRLEPFIASLLAVTVGLLASSAVSGFHWSTQATATPAPAATPAIKGGPRRLAIEAAPAPAVPAVPVPAVPARREVARAGRSTAGRSPARPARAIAAAPHAGTAARIPNQAERVLVERGSDEEKSLRKSEREHISWMEKLVNTPADPDLHLPRRS